MDSHDLAALLLLLMGGAFLLHLRSKRARIVGRAIARHSAPADRSTREPDDAELLEIIARKEDELEQKRRGGGAYRGKG